MTDLNTVVVLETAEHVCREVMLITGIQEAIFFAGLYIVGILLFVFFILFIYNKLAEKYADDDLSL